MGVFSQNRAAGYTDLTPEEGEFGGHRAVPYMQAFYAVTQLHDGFQQYKEETADVKERPDRPSALSR